MWLIYGSISSRTSPKRPRDKVSKRDESKDRNFDLRKKLFLGPLRFGSPTGLKKTTVDIYLHSYEVGRELTHVA